MLCYSLIETDHLDIMVAYEPEYLLLLDCWIGAEDARLAVLFLGFAFQIDARWPWLD